MGYFICDAVLFTLGLLAFVSGWVPLTRRRSVNGSAARVVGFILMIPLPLFVLACERSHVSPFDPNEGSMDPLMPFTVGFVRLACLLATTGSVLAAAVFAMATSEKRRRN